MERGGFVLHTNAGALATNNASFRPGPFTACVWAKWSGTWDSLPCLLGGSTDDTFSAPTSLGWFLWCPVATPRRVRATLTNNGVLTTHTAISTATSSFADVWRHYAMSLSASGTLSLYIDGQPEARGSGIPNTGITDTTRAIVVGGWRPDAYSHFGGFLDDVRVYDTCLSDAEIAAVALNEL